MAPRPSKKTKLPSTNPETIERLRLKSIATNEALISTVKPRVKSCLSPSKEVLKHGGCDIVKKSSGRKGRFLFMFPGLVGVKSGSGKIGELKDLETKNPVMYLDFPMGQMKLFGTIVYPENRYLTLQFSKGGKNVVCEDYLDNMIIFSEAWWIGRKEDNPEELWLETPKEITEAEHKDYDFKGGAGAVGEEKPVLNKVKRVCEPSSPRAETEDDVSEDCSTLSGKSLKGTIEATPIRQSARTAGKTFKFVEVSPENNSVEVDDIIPTAKKKVHVEKSNTEDDDLSLEVHSVDSAFYSRSDDNTQPDLLVKKPNPFSLCNRAPLIQVTLSSLFEKMEEKNSKPSVRSSSVSKVSTPNRKRKDTKKSTVIVEAEVPKKKGRIVKERNPDAETQTIAEQKQSQGDDDDIEDFSSESEDIDVSDEDWAA